jgi:hypothetical protein
MVSFLKSLDPYSLESFDLVLLKLYETFFPSLFTKFMVDKKYLKDSLFVSRIIFVAGIVKHKRLYNFLELAAVDCAPLLLFTIAVA